MASLFIRLLGFANAISRGNIAYCLSNILIIHLTVKVFSSLIHFVVLSLKVGKFKSIIPVCCDELRIITDYHTMTAFDNWYIDEYVGLVWCEFVDGLVATRNWQSTLQHMPTCTELYLFVFRQEMMQ